MTQAATALTDIFGPVISAYTQADAIEDGILVPVTSIANRHGLKVSTLITFTLLTQILGDENAANFKDRSFQVYPEISLLFQTIIQQIRSNPQQSEFTSSSVNFQGGTLFFKACMASDDNGGPCVIISLPDED